MKVIHYFTLSVGTYSENLQLCNVSEFTYFLGGVSAESERECVASNEVTLAGLIDALLHAKVDLRRRKLSYSASTSVTSVTQSVSSCSTKIMNTYDFKTVQKRVQNVGSTDQKYTSSWIEFQVRIIRTRLYAAKFHSNLTFSHR